MKKSLLFILIVTFAFSANAQVLQKSIQKLQGLKNLSYTEIVRMKWYFERDFNADTIKADIAMVPTEPQIGGYYRFVSRNSISLFDGKQSVSLYLPDTTYRTSKDAEAGQYASLLYWIKESREYGAKTSRVKHLVDTLINKVAYDHVLITVYDSLEKNIHTYTREEFITNKRTCLPYAFKMTVKGFSEDGTLGGFIEERLYSNYRLNSLNFPDLSEAKVPEGFRQSVKKETVPFLANGTKAPILTLTNLDGHTFDMKSLKGRVVLLNFTTNGCLHCVNAAQMLNKLSEKYKNNAFTIMSIYQLGYGNKKEVIRKFNKQLNVKYACFTTPKTAEGIYHLSGYPNFYLLDKHGNIAQSYDGFYTELESQLTAKIDSMQ